MRSVIHISIRLVQYCPKLSAHNNDCLLQKSAGIREQMVSLLRAQEVMEQKFTSARNESISNSIKIADSTSELAKQGRTDSINANLKATSLNNEYKQDESTHVEKIVAEKSKAIEQIETDLAIVSQASERLKANAESFVNSGKDAWNNHYEKTEVELREKSDASSNHVQGICYDNFYIRLKNYQRIHLKIFYHVHYLSFRSPNSNFRSPLRNFVVSIESGLNVRDPSEIRRKEFDARTSKTFLKMSRSKRFRNSILWPIPNPRTFPKNFRWRRPETRCTDRKHSNENR